MKIGIFDSGLGGLFLMKPIVAALPQYDYLYLGDTKNLPYGDKSQEEIYRFTRRAVKYLLTHGCAIVLVMCNTASAMALRRIQQEGYRALGIIIPTVEEACLAQSRRAQGKRIGILATQSTVDSGAYSRELEKAWPGVEVFQQAAPQLVPMIESGNYTIFAYASIVKSYLDPLLAQNIDTLILGCTHYVVLKDLIRKLAPGVRVISQDELIADKVRDYLARHSEIESVLSKKGTRNYLATRTTHLQSKKNFYIINAWV